MMTLAPVRADTLPENASYRDDGCSVSTSCLSCPLPLCKFDDPGWIARTRRVKRDRAVVRTQREEGLSVGELAARFNVSARTIHRILQSERSGALEREIERGRFPWSPLSVIEGRSLFRTPTPLPPIRRGRERGRAVGIAV